MGIGVYNLTNHANPVLVSPYYGLSTYRALIEALNARQVLLILDEAGFRHTLGEPAPTTRDGIWIECIWQKDGYVITAYFEEGYLVNGRFLAICLLRSAKIRIPPFRQAVLV